MPLTRQQYVHGFACDLRESLGDAAERFANDQAVQNGLAGNDANREIWAEIRDAIVTQQERAPPCDEQAPNVNLAALSGRAA